jgi:hypothetical protein
MERSEVIPPSSSSSSSSSSLNHRLLGGFHRPVFSSFQRPSMWMKVKRGKELHTHWQAALSQLALLLHPFAAIFRPPTMITKIQAFGNHVVCSTAAMIDPSLPI